CLQHPVGGFEIRVVEIFVHVPAQTYQLIFIRQRQRAAILGQALGFGAAVCVFFGASEHVCWRYLI
ncbi:hypothetical protein QN388_25160, partial [Pseudomonas sp. 5B4]